MLQAAGAVEPVGGSADAAEAAAGDTEGTVAATDGLQPVGGFQHPDMRATSGELARRNSPEALVRCIDAVSACRETLGMNVKPEVALDALGGALREACRVS